MDPFDPAAVRSAYDAVAEDYVRAFADDLDQLPLDRLILDKAVEQVSGDVPVLDLGCGPGQVASYVAGPGVQAVGVDLSTRMLSLAAERTSGIEYACGDMLSLPFRSDSFSGVIAFYSIQHVARASLTTALQEVRRVLVPEGIFVVALHLGVGEKYTEEFLGHQIERTGGTFYSEEELRGALRTHSFSIELTEQRDPLDHEYPSRRIYLIARKVGKSA
jgi:ubiquinone/menaquinone biosynthesis C-methylase UbiE